MKGIILLAVALVGVGSAGGCCSCGSNTGWEFKVGRPASISMPALVQQTTGPLATLPLGSTIPPIIAGGALPRMQFGVAPDCEPMPRSRLNSLADSCTLEDVCRALARLEQRMGTRTLERLPLPKGAGPDME